MSSMFEQALKQTLNNEVSITENGAVGFKTSGKKLLDINFAIASLRSKSANEIQKMFSDAFYEDPILAVKWLFMLRDVRGGMGERRSFRICFSWLANTCPKAVEKLIPLVAEYGRWDDLLLSGLEGDLWKAVVDIVNVQWTNDVNNMEVGKPISLLAKWMPSVNTSSVKTVALARKLAAELNMPEKVYRKTLSKLRKYLNVIEQKMSAKQWNEINYEAVPSKANVKYNSAFLRNDEARRREFLGKLEKGEAKINSATNFPCDIVHSYMNSHYTIKSYDAAIEGMWKALPNYIADQESGSTIVVADSSGSMGCTIGSGTITAVEVAYSLAIYFAEKLVGPFKDKTITFSSHPKYLDMSNAKTLREKLDIMFKHSEYADTNVEKVFDLILKTAVDNKLSQNDIPSNVLIVSDMEFNAAQCQSSWSIPPNWDAKQNALFTRIAQKWENASYKLPRLVFWNVNSRTGTIPVQTNKNGVALVSGFSPAVAKMVFSAKLDPFEVLKDAINVPRYDAVEAAIKDVIA